MTIANLDSDLRWTQGSLWSLAAIAGTALQLQQPDLWSVAAYGQCLAGCLMAVAACFGGVRALGRRRHFSRRWSAPGWCLVQIVLAFSFAGAAFALVGLRACVFDTDRLDPALEGCDVQVVGLVRDLTQNTASGLRFRLQVESAQLDGQKGYPFSSKILSNCRNERNPCYAPRRSGLPKDLEPVPRMVPL